MNHSFYRLICVVLCAILCMFAACAGDTIRVVQRSFERSQDAAFACIDANEKVFVPLGECEVSVSDDEESSKRRVAFVTQNAQGEVAAVDLEDENLGGGLLDTDIRVPGVTFTRVGEGPQGIVVIPDQPAWTYVAEFGSQTLQAIPTDRLHPLADRTERERLQIALGCAPTELVAIPSGRALVAVCPARGAVVSVALTADGRFEGTPQLVELDSLSPPTATPLVDAARGQNEKFCPPELSFSAVPEPGATPPTDAGSTFPKAMHLLVDRERDLLLVGDESRPYLTIFPISESGFDTSNPSFAASGVPFHDLALTPLVPTGLDGNFQSLGDAPQRFLYGIDESDGSILVMNATDADPSQWAMVVLGDMVARPFRVAFDVRAEGLEVITPRYFNGSACDPADDDVSAVRLRGVFVAVVLTDGTLRFLDVQDLDAPCRAGVACQNPASINDDQVATRRHHPRFSAIESNLRLFAAPTSTIGPVQLRLGLDGTTPSPDTPTLLPFTECPFEDRFVQVYPGISQPGETLICTLGDPWKGSNERWSLDYEGVIPGSRGGQGRFAQTFEAAGIPRPGSWVVANGAEFCDNGVLGQDNVPPEPAAPESAYAGDLLAIVSDVPDALREDVECAPFVLDEQDERDLLAFPVIESYQSALRIGASSVGPIVTTLEAAQRCFPGDFEYEVRTRGSYAIVGNVSGFVHRVVEGALGACGFDARKPFLPENPESYLNSRVFPGVAFQSPHLALQLTLSDEGRERLEQRQDRSRLRFEIVGRTPELSINLSTAAGSEPILPASLRFNTADQRLYLVEDGRRGFVRFDPEELNAAVRAFDTRVSDL